MPVWNWQLPEWPSFRFDAHRLAAAEEQFAQGAGALERNGARRHVRYRLTIATRRVPRMVVDADGRVRAVEG